MLGFLPPNLRGPLLMIIAMSAFGTGDMLVKLMLTQESLPIYQVIAIRNSLLSLVMLALCLQSLGLEGLLSQLRRPLPWLFGVGEIGVAWPYLYSLKLLPLQTAQPVIKVAPLIGVVLTVLFFGQRAGLFRWLAVVCGFLGVLIVIEPWTGFQASGLVILPFTAALVLAVRDAFMSNSGGRVEPVVIGLTMSLAVLALGIVGSVLELDGPWQPLSAKGWWLVAPLAACAGFGYVFRSAAVLVAPYPVIAPFTYIGIVWAAVYGTLIFGDPLTAGQLAGSALVIGGGLLLIWRQSVRPR